jgi:hypothetical protein
MRSLLGAGPIVLALVVQEPASSRRAPDVAVQVTDDAPEQRAAFLREGEQALALGALDRAAAALERAAQLGHTAEVEMTQVRAMMQAGQYRHAAALAAHTAGAHRDEGATPAALYAWLLALGGQEAFATRVLDEALAASPDHPLALQVRRLMHDSRLPAAPFALQPPHRLAPYAMVPAGTSPPPDDARVTATGVLWDRGTRALVSTSALNEGARYWVRNALGQTRTATRAQPVPELELSVLELDVPLPAGSVCWTGRDPFAGSPASLADYRVGSAAPSWPRLHFGFLGGLTARSTVRRLGIDLPGSAGGPVFDAAGRVTGFALSSSSHPAPNVFVTATQLIAMIGSPEVKCPAQQTASVSFDESYERAMYAALQVIVSRDAPVKAPISTPPPSAGR